MYILRHIGNLLILALNIWTLLLVIHVILSWTKTASNKYTVLLSRIVEPVLEPIRRFLRQVLPAQLQVLDLSPIVAWILVSILRSIIQSIFYWSF